MRSLLALALVLGCAASAQGQAKAGAHILSLQAGTSLPLTRYTVPDVPVGNQGAAFGGRYLYNWRPRIGFGADLLYSAFGSKPFSSVTHDVLSRPRLLQALAVGKYSFLPEWKWRPYALGGLGAGVFSLRKTATPQAAGAGTTEVDGSSTGLSFALAGGFDWDLTPRLTAGLELRWSQTAIDKTRFFGDKLQSFDAGALLGYRLGGR
jgi:opacity protein-like surface antigen